MEDDAGGILVLESSWKTFDKALVVLLWEGVKWGRLEKAPARPPPLPLPLPLTERSRLINGKVSADGASFFGPFISPSFALSNELLKTSLALLDPENELEVHCVGVPTICASLGRSSGWPACCRCSDSATMFEIVFLLQVVVVNWLILILSNRRVITM